MEEQSNSSFEPTGFFDFQVNGFAGVDYQSVNLTLDDLHKSVQALSERGFKSIFLTLISDDLTSLEKKLKNISSFRLQDKLISGMIAGIHLEGPYLSPVEGFRGAHPESVMKAPDVDEYKRLQEAADGTVRLITLAPEWPGSPRFIDHVCGEKVSISLGHTNASDCEIGDSIAAGARFCTHLGNGVPRTLDRHDNIVQRLLARDELTACLIPDGIHLPPHVLRNYYRAKPKGKVLFTSDCMAAAGAKAGTYTLGNLSLEVGMDGVVRLPDSSFFAGSSLCLDAAPPNLMHWLGIDIEQASSLCGETSARAFGLDW